MNFIGLVVGFSVLGVATRRMHDTVNTFMTFFTDLNTVTMRISSWVVFVSPIGIFFLIVSQILETDDLRISGEKLLIYFVTVMGGILLHSFIILPIIFYFITKKNPYAFLIGMAQAIVMAFGMSSR